VRPLADHEGPGIAFEQALDRAHTIGPLHEEYAQAIALRPSRARIPRTDGNIMAWRLRWVGSV